VISDLTYRITKHHIDADKLEKKVLKGIEKPVQAHLVKRIKPLSRIKSSVSEIPLISRRRELKEIQTIMQAVHIGEAQGEIVVVTGEAGIGKTRLLDELIQSVQVKQVLHLHCLDREKHTMLHPVIRALRELVVDRSIDKFVSAQIDSTTSIEPARKHQIKLAIELLLSSEGVADDEQTIKIDRKTLLDALVEYFKFLNAEQISLVIVEDLHWADPSTLELLESIVDSLAELKLLLVITTRPIKPPVCLQGANIHRINLTPLTQQESIEFISSIVPSNTLTRKQCDKIAKHCDGIPVYLKELSFYIAQQANKDIIDEIGSPVPETLRDLLIARIDQLGSNSEIIQSASVFGREFTASQIGIVSQLSPEQIDRELESLFAAGILQIRDAPDMKEYQFSHALLADAVYASLLNTSKKELHAKVALMLDGNIALAEKDPEIAAFHYEGAENIDQAIVFRELAGKRAALRSANNEAAYHYSKAVEHTSLLPDSDAKRELELRLRLVLGTQLIANNGNAAPQVGSNYLRAKELSHIVTNEHLRIETYYGLWSYHQVCGRMREALEMSRAMIDVPICSSLPDMDMTASRAHGLCLFAMGKFDDSKTHLDRALCRLDQRAQEASSLVDVSDTEVLLQCSAGWLYCYLAMPNKALELHHQAISRAEDNNYHHSLAYALALSAASHQVMDDKLQTREHSSRLIDLSLEQDFPYWRAWGEMLYAWSAVGLQGENANARFDLGMQAYERTSAKMMNAYFGALRAELDIKSENFTDALQRLDDSEKFSINSGALFYVPEIHRLRSEVYVQCGDTDAAYAEIEKARAVALSQGNALLLEKIKLTGAQCRAPVS